MSQNEGPMEPFSELRPKTCYKPEEIWKQLVVELTETDNLYGDDDLLARLEETDDLESIYRQEVDVEERALYDSQSEMMFRGFREWCAREGLENSVSACARWDGLSSEERRTILESIGKKDITRKKNSPKRNAFFPKNGDRLMHYKFSNLYQKSATSNNGQSASVGSSWEQRVHNDDSATLLSVEILDSVPPFRSLSLPTVRVESDEDEDEELADRDNDEQTDWISTTPCTSDPQEDVMVQRTSSKDTPSLSRKPASLSHTVSSVPFMSECATHARHLSALDAAKETAPSPSRKKDIHADAAWSSSPQASAMNRRNISSMSMNKETRDTTPAVEHSTSYHGADDHNKVGRESPSPQAHQGRERQSSPGEDSNASTLIYTPEGGIYEKKARKSLRQRVKDLIDAKSAVRSCIFGSSGVDQTSSEFNLNAVPQKISAAEQENHHDTSIRTVPLTTSDKERSGYAQEVTMQTTPSPTLINSPANGASSASPLDSETQPATPPIFVESLRSAHDDETQRNACASPTRELAGCTSSHDVNSRADSDEKKGPGESRVPDAIARCMDTKPSARDNPSTDVLKTHDGCKLDENEMPVQCDDLTSAQQADDVADKGEVGKNRYSDAPDFCNDAVSNTTCFSCDGMQKCGECNTKSSVLNGEITSLGSNQSPTTLRHDSPPCIEPNNDHRDDTAEPTSNTSRRTSRNPSSDALKANGNIDDCDRLDEENVPSRQNSLQNTNPRDNFADNTDEGERCNREISEPCSNATSSTNSPTLCGDAVKLNGNHECRDKRDDDARAGSIDDSPRGCNHHLLRNVIDPTQSPKTTFHNCAYEDPNDLNGANREEKNGDFGKPNNAQKLIFDTIENTCQPVDIVSDTTTDDDSTRKKDGVDMFLTTDVGRQAGISQQSNVRPMNEDNDVTEPTQIRAAHTSTPPFGRFEGIPESNSPPIPSVLSLDETGLPQGCSSPSEGTSENLQECCPDLTMHSEGQSPRQESCMDTRHALAPNVLFAAKRSPTHVTLNTRSSPLINDSEVCVNAPSPRHTNTKSFERDKLPSTPRIVVTDSRCDDAVPESPIPQSAEQAQQLAVPGRPQPDSSSAQQSDKEDVDKQVDNMSRHNGDNIVLGKERTMASYKPQKPTVEPKCVIADHTKAESMCTAKQKAQPAAKRARAPKKRKMQGRTTTTQGGTSSLFIEVDPSELPSNCMLDEEPAMLSLACGDTLPSHSNADADHSVANRKRPEVEEDNNGDTVRGPKRKRNKTIDDDKTTESDDTGLLFEKTPEILSGESLENARVDAKHKDTVMKRGRKQRTPTTGRSKHKPIPTSSTAVDHVDEAARVDPTHNSSTNAASPFNVNPAVLPGESLEQLGLVAERKVRPTKRARNKSTGATERSKHSTAPVSPAKGEHDSEATRLEAGQHERGHGMTSLLGAHTAVQSLEEAKLAAKQKRASTKRVPNYRIAVDECSEQTNIPTSSTDGDRGDHTIRLERKPHVRPRQKKQSRKLTAGAEAASHVTRRHAASVQDSTDAVMQQTSWAPSKESSSLDLRGRTVSAVDHFLTHWWHVRGSRHDHSPGRRSTPPPEELGPLPSDVRAPWIVWYDYYSDAFASDFDDTEHIRLAFLRLPLAIREEFIQVSNWENECFMHFVKEQAGSGPWGEDLLERWKCLGVMEKWQRVPPWGEPCTPVPLSFVVEQKQVLHMYACQQNKLSLEPKGTTGKKHEKDKMARTARGRTTTASTKKRACCSDNDDGTSATSRRELRTQANKSAKKRKKVASRCCIVSDDDSISDSQRTCSSADGHDIKKEFHCIVCAKDAESDDNEILLCDMCDRGYHQYCHAPPVLVIGSNEEKWFCHMCTGKLIQLRELPYTVGDIVWYKANKTRPEMPCIIKSIDFSDFNDAAPFWVTFFPDHKEGMWADQNLLKSWDAGIEAYKKTHARRKPELQEEVQAAVVAATELRLV